MILKILQFCHMNVTTEPYNPLCMNQMPDIQLFMAGILSGIA